MGEGRIVTMGAPVKEHCDCHPPRTHEQTRSERRRRAPGTLIYPPGTVWECDHGIQWTASAQGGWMSQVLGTPPPDWFPTRRPTPNRREAEK